jgi:hypothetical protein
MKQALFEGKDFLAQLMMAFEVVEPHSTLIQQNAKVGLKSLARDFIREYGYDEKPSLDFENLLEFSRYIEERCDSLFLMAPFTEALRRNVSRAIDAYAGKAIFVGDHNHIYQPDRVDKGFGDYVHEKISKECYERMSRLYRFYSVDVGPTLAEWFRARRPDIFQNLLKTHQIEPLMAQSYTHRILPIIKEDEDLLAEIEAGLLYHRRTFGYADDDYPKGMWLPECCISERVAVTLARSGIDFVILRSDQSAYRVQPGQVYKLSMKSGEMLPPLYAFYYHHFSKELSFDKWTTDNPALTLNHILAGAQPDHFYLMAHDGELVHHRFEHSGVDVTGFFREFPMEVYRRDNPCVILITPGRYLQFLRIRSLINGEPLDFPRTELPDFPTSWSCGGYALKSFFEVKGVTLESLKEKKDEELLEFYAEFLVLRDLQRSHNDPVEEDAWALMVKIRKEELQSRFSADKLTDEEKDEIMADLERGVNICYDNRRFQDMKVAGAGRWVYGSLDSGDSVYQTYLTAAASLLEEQIQGILARKTDGLFKDRGKAKAFYLASGMDHIDGLEKSSTPEERLKFLQEHYSKTITADEIAFFKTGDEFFDEFLAEPLRVSSKERQEILELLRLWSLTRAAKTSCAYFFDDLNNHVSEDAVIRIAEAVHQLEDVHKDRVAPEVFENLKSCKSRYRRARGQGPDVTAYEVAMRHLNIQRIQHYITKFEGLSLEQFNSFIKDNLYSLPHPEGSSREYYRAFSDEKLVAFTSHEGVEMLLTKLSREVARTSKDAHIVIEKRDLENGEIINRLQMEVKYDQLIAEKPYVASDIDPDIYLSIKIDDREAALISQFIVDNIIPLLPGYGLDARKIQTIYVNKDRFTLDYAEPHTRSRRKGPSSKGIDVFMYKKGVQIENLASMKHNLRFIRREKERLADENPGIEGINPLWMERVPGHLESLLHSKRIRQIVYGSDGNPGLLKKIEKSPDSLEVILEGTLQSLAEQDQSLNVDLLKTFVLQRIFLFHDFNMGKYEIEQKSRLNRKISMKEAVLEYCRKEKIPYGQDMVAFKLWKYRREEIKRYGNLTREEEKITRLIHQSLVLKTNRDGDESYAMISHPILYFHGAANEANNEAFYPDNEVIPRIAEGHPGQDLKVCFFPGSVAFVDQYSYLKKMRRYLGEKFGISDVHGALFASGEKSEVLKIREKDERIFTLPSITEDGQLRYFSSDRHSQVSSRHIQIDYEKELKSLEEFMEQCHIVYLGGGHSFLLGLRLTGLRLPVEKEAVSFEDALRSFLLRGGLLMTLSAGTMAAGDRIINFKVKRMELNNDSSALGIAQAIFQVHFEEYGLPEHLVEIREKYPHLPVIGIDTQTALMDLATVRITSRDASLMKNPVRLSMIEKSELLKESLVVMGSRTLNLRDDTASIYLDGQELPLSLPLFNHRTPQLVGS